MSKASSTTTPAKSGEKFTLQTHLPYETYVDGKPQRTPFIIDGLMANAGFSILGGKPKCGKSSLARHAAVCVAKGLPFLGRAVEQGECLIVSVEDPRTHADNCLGALDYDLKKDARIHLVDKLAPKADDSIEAIGEFLTGHPDIKLVIIDTLPRLLRVRDLNDYSLVQPEVEKVHDLARRFPQLHVCALAHCKKVATDDPFDSLLGSSALRAETDANIAVYLESGQRVIAAETRIGRSIEPTIMGATMVERYGSDVVAGYSLKAKLADHDKEVSDRSETKRLESLESRIIRFLQDRQSLQCTQAHLLDKVSGQRSKKIDAIERLLTAGVLRTTGKKQHASDPLTLHLIEGALVMHDFVNKFGKQTE